MSEVIIRPDLIADGIDGMPIIFCDTGDEDHIVQSDDLKVEAVDWADNWTNDCKHNSKWAGVVKDGKVMTWAQVEALGGYTLKIEVTQPSKGYDKRPAIAVNIDWEWV